MPYGVRKDFALRASFHLWRIFCFTKRKVQAIKRNPTGVLGGKVKFFAIYEVCAYINTRLPSPTRGVPNLNPAELTKHIGHMPIYHFVRVYGFVWPWKDMFLVKNLPINKL
jgi:hypothetical protein